jgi:uncharacterized protein (TIGR02246 family)
MLSPWIISAILVIGLAPPTFAQQVDPDTRQQVERLAATYAECFNKQDAAGIASLYARDGVLVSRAAKAVKTGAQEIEQTYQSVFKSGMNHTDMTVDQVSPLGTDAVIAMGEYHGSGHGQNGPIEVDGHWTGVDVREGGTWKIRLLTAFPNPPATATGSDATPSGPMR